MEASDKAHLAAALAGVDVVISAISPFDAHLQYALADAAKAAGVKRFVPSSFTAVTPASGITDGRDEASLPDYSDFFCFFKKKSYD